MNGDAEAVVHRPRDIAPDSDDLCFLTQSTPRQGGDHCKSCILEIEEGPVGRTAPWARPSLSMAASLPDGNLIEVSSCKSCKEVVVLTPAASTSASHAQCFPRFVAFRNRRRSG
jgi:hypothetical protein